MIIGIVIPLKARLVSTDWKQTSRVLAQTVQSLNNQTSKSFKAVICGHNAPTFIGEENDLLSENIFFCKYDATEPPTAEADQRTTYLKREFDRCNKIQAGIQYLNNLFGDEITHWFPLDADDLVRSDFVARMRLHSERQAVIMDHGYQLHHSSGTVNQLDEFSQWCGSSALLSRELVKIPADFSPSEATKMIFRAVSHNLLRDELIERGVNLAIERERLVMYVLGHGDNLSFQYRRSGIIEAMKTRIKFLLRSVGGSKAIKNSFGIEN